jgi:replicative DNA helicase
MSKLFSADLEKRVLKTALSSKEGIASWGLLTDKHFATEVGSLAFKRAELLFRKKGELPSWSSLCADPTLPSNVKGALKAFKVAPSRIPKNIAAQRENLDSYRKRRALNELIRTVSDALDEEAKDVDAIMDVVSRSFADIGQAGSELKIDTIGKGDTALKVVNEALYGKQKLFIPTGFKTFDSYNHGIPLGSNMLVVGESGSGKSAVLGSLAKNMALQGNKVLFAPLEMDSTGMLQRGMADLTGMSLTKFLNPSKAMTRDEKLKALKAYKQLSRRIATAEGKWTFINHDHDVSIDTILSYAKAHSYRVVIIDYAGLLAGTDGDDQAKALSRVAKVAKRWATVNNAVVIMAAQLSDEGKVKYSRALKEWASVMWTFTRDAKDKEQNTVTVRPEKSRQQTDTPFSLHMDLSTMTIRDMTAEESAQARKAKDGSSGPRGGKPGSKKGLSGARFFDNL